MVQRQRVGEPKGKESSWVVVAARARAADCRIVLGHFTSMPPLTAAAWLVKTVYLLFALRSALKCGSGASQANLVKEVVNPNAKIEFRENTADDPGRRK